MKPAFYGELNSRQLVCYGGEALGRGPQAREAAVQLQTIEAIKQAGNNAAYDAMISAGLQMMSGSQPRSAISPMRECTVTNTGFQHNTVDCW